MKAKKASLEEVLSHHLQYELDMLRGTYNEIAKGGHDTVVTNALIESFCIHARLLIEFFSNNKKGHIAQEFTGGVYYAAHIGSIAGSVQKLNTQIAHLTGKRTSDPAEKIGAQDRTDWLSALEKEARNFEGQLHTDFKGMFKAPSPYLSVSSTPGASSEISTA